MLINVSTPPSDPIVQELQALRASLDALTERVGDLTTDNAQLRDQLEQSQNARRDLAAQSDHLVHQLDLARKEVRTLKGN